MIDMVKQAKKCGHHAKYILFDSWFSCPCIVADLKKECQLDTIAMVKKNQNIRYSYNGEMLDIKTIYKRCKKRPGRSKYLLSGVVDVVSFDKNGRKITVPAKIVCVRNRNKKKIALRSSAQIPNCQKRRSFAFTANAWILRCSSKAASLC